ncbi:RNA pseudouridylate synthase domain containing protein 2 [Dissophora ornata]|nr:RNA pseudouridylate synthase domain containing protein 2 [Dissophora ornata]
MSPKVLRARKGRAEPIETPVPEYFFEGGLRKVKPYRQTYLAHVKQRWVNRTVPDVFASEMPRRCTKNMIIEAMKRGDVLVNDTIVSPEYVLKGGESLRSINCHRHAINRLDAVTSGVVIFANVADPVVRERFQPPNVDPDAGSDALVQKEYVCRVVGEFPKDPIVVTEPILQIAGKVVIDPAGKPSETRFERKWYDASSNTSLVSCFLATGRQHQIRLHVAHLHHPIVNDRLYNPDYMADWTLKNPAVTANGETRFYPTEIPPESQPYMPYYITPETPCHKCIEEQEGANVPNPKYMKIWLRAIRYQGPDWKFEVDMPDWAVPTVLE